MGYIVHHSIIVSAWEDKRLRETWRKAKEIFADTEHHISNITPQAINGERSYFIAPDGSKKGWDDSYKGFEARKQFIEYLKSLELSPAWVLLQFHDDENDSHVIDSDNGKLTPHYD
jgi:hypothetical protein